MRLRAAPLLSYSALQCALAFGALPLYIHAPKLYESVWGLSLTTLGLILLGVRMVDAAQDPLLGALADRFHRTAQSRFMFMLAGLPFFALGFVMLFSIPSPPSIPVAWWFALSLMITSAAYAMISISYHSMGAELSSDYHERTRIVTFREALGLVGIMLASVLPDRYIHWWGAQMGYAALGYTCLALLVVTSCVTFLFSPRPSAPVAPESALTMRKSLLCFRNRHFTKLAAVFWVNGVATAIPSVLFVFYVRDVLKVEAQTGYFLLVYFISGAAGMPFWNWLSTRMGKKNAWNISMVVSVVTFAGAYFLGQENASVFYLVCVLSGLCFGANMVLPVSMLADTMDYHSAPGTAAYFGWWSLIGKLGFAAAAGVALPLVEWAGYSTTAPVAEGLHAVSAVYALLPCAIQCLAILLLHCFHLEISPENHHA